MPAARVRDDAPAAPPRSDAYTGLLTVSLLALLAGAVFLYLDYSQYPTSAPPKVGPPAASGPAPGGPVTPPK